MFQFCCCRCLQSIKFSILCFALRPPPPLIRVSESSELSDSFEELPRSKSPETAIEAISGVQPELQSTPKDSEIYSKFLLFLFFYFIFIKHFLYLFLQQFHYVS